MTDLIKPEMFKKHHTVAFVLKDNGCNGGDIPQKGWIKEASDSRLHYYHEEGGECSVPMEQVIKPKVGKKAIDRKKMIIKRPAPEKEPKRYDAVKGAKNPKPGSKQEMVAKIYAEHGGSKTRGEIIQIIVDDLGMSKAGASTYYQTAKKAAS